jgi:XTP/dITP diphosphohydrolase
VSDPPLAIVIASANRHKVDEILAILEPLVASRVAFVSRPDEIGEIDETGDSLEENARLKATVVAEVTGLPAVADDTGLEVDALSGAPGVFSARYAGEGASDEENVAKLLAALEGVTDRTARFRTAAVVVFPDGRSISAAGAVEGRISTRRQGDAGFGYDPLFIPDGEARSLAELSSQEKHALSHRGRAFRALATALLSSLDDREGK